MKLEFFDSHAHAEIADRGDCAPYHDVARRARIAGVRAILLAATDPGEFQAIRGLCVDAEEDPRLPRMGWAAGLHPWKVTARKARDWEALEAQLSEAASAADARLVAIGETGVDRRRNADALDAQLVSLRLHLRVAAAHALPIVLHCVDAHAIVMSELSAHARVTCVIHSFSGPPERARAWTRAGHVLGISGAVTNARARRLRETVATLEWDTFMLETDSPEQTPLARRPQRNEPAFVVEVAREVAALRSCSLEEVAERTTRTAERVFGQRGTAWSGA